MALVCPQYITSQSTRSPLFPFMCYQAHLRWPSVLCFRLSQLLPLSLSFLSSFLASRLIRWLQSSPSCWHYLSCFPPVGLLGKSLFLWPLYSNIQN